MNWIQIFYGMIEMAGLPPKIKKYNTPFGSSTTTVLSHFQEYNFQLISSWLSRASRGPLTVWGWLLVWCEYALEYASQISDESRLKNNKQTIFLLFSRYLTAFIQDLKSQFGIIPLAF